MSTRTIDFLRELIAIDSVNPSLVPGGAGEQQIAEAIAAELHAIGADVELQPVAPGRPNVVGVLEGRRAGPALVLCGHLDTVGVAGMDAPFNPIVRDKRVHGRGAQDMKGGLAAIVGAVRRIADSGGIEAGRVVVAGVCDEEDASRGAEAFVERWRRGDATPHPASAVVTEPTDLRVGIAHKGFAWLQVTTTGRAAHGSRPREGRDAILRMGRLLARLDEFDRERQVQPGHPLLGPASLHASFIEGGREWSTYPDRCDLRLERRTIPGEDPDQPVLEISRILESLVQEDEEFSASVDLIFARLAYEIREDHRLVHALRTAAGLAGATADLCGLSFWADSSVLGEAGIPTALFGPGGAGLHGLEEYVRIDDVLVCEDALARLARALCV
jgi:acetylornithine deacetylase